MISSLKKIFENPTIGLWQLVGLLPKKIDQLIDLLSLSFQIPRPHEPARSVRPSDD